MVEAGSSAAGTESWREFGERVAGATDAICATSSRRSRTGRDVGGRDRPAGRGCTGAGAEAAIQLNLQTRNTGITEMVRGRSVSRLVASTPCAPRARRPRPRGDALVAQAPQTRLALLHQRRELRVSMVAAFCSICSR